MHWVLKKILDWDVPPDQSRKQRAKRLYNVLKRTCYGLLPHALSSNTNAEYASQQLIYAQDFTCIRTRTASDPRKKLCTGLSSLTLLNHHIMINHLWYRTLHGLNMEVMGYLWGLHIMACDGGYNVTKQIPCHLLICLARQCKIAVAVRWVAIRTNGGITPNYKTLFISNFFVTAVIAKHCSILISIPLFAPVSLPLLVKMAHLSSLCGGTCHPRPERLTESTKKGWLGGGRLSQRKILVPSHRRKGPTASDNNKYANANSYTNDITNSSQARTFCGLSFSVYRSVISWKELIIELIRLFWNRQKAA